MALNTDAIVGANPDDCFWHLSSTTGRHVLVGKMRCKKVLLFKPFRVRGKASGPFRSHPQLRSTVPHAATRWRQPPPRRKGLLVGTSGEVVHLSPGFISQRLSAELFESLLERIKLSNQSKS